MKNLPLETLSLIFRLELSDSYRGPEDAWNTILIPLRVSQVCRHWRYASLTFGTLWSFLNVEYISGKYRCPERQGKYRNAIIEIFHLWLKRTNGAPLNFSITCGSIAAEDEVAQVAFEGIASTLLHHQRRWERMTIHLNFMPTEDFPGFVLDNMPKLVSLNLSWCNFDVDNNPPKFARINLALSPKLELLILHGRCTLDAGKSINARLTRAQLNFVEEHGNHFVLHECWRVFRLAPALEHFACDFPDYDWYQGFDVLQFHDVEPLVLPNLKHMTMNLVHASKHMLAKLTLPSLVHLGLMTDGYEGTERVFLELIERSRPPLEKLMLWGACAKEEILLSVLRYLPNLKFLSLEYADASARLFDALTVPDYSSAASRNIVAKNLVLCPDLHALSIRATDFSDNIDVVMVAFCQMLTSRWKYNRSFTKVLIDYLREDNIRYESTELPIKPYSRDYHYLCSILNEDVEILVHGDTYIPTSSYWDYEKEEEST